MDNTNNITRSKTMEHKHAHKVTFTIYTYGTTYDEVNALTAAIYNALQFGNTINRELYTKIKTAKHTTEITKEVPTT